MGYVASISPEEVINLTNKEREKAGLNQLETNSQLTEAALQKASYMFAKNYWAHTAPDGTEPWKFILDTNYKYRYAGENLARDFATPETVVSAWLDSPSHKDNLLSSRYQDIGVAVVKGELNGIQTTLVVQMFGTRMSVAQALENNEVAKAGNVSEQTQVAGLNNENKFVISPFNINKNVAILLISVFMLVLSIDMIIINQNKVTRSASRSFAHFLFFGVIMVAIIVSKVGNVL